MKAVSVQAIGLTFLCSVVTAQPEGAAWGSVLKVGDEFTFKEGLHKGAVAQARFLDAQHTRSYLGQLHLRTSDMFPDEQQMFAAGFLEAWMTAGRIRDYYENTLHYFKHQLKADLKKPMQWLRDQDTWTRQQLQQNGTSDLYWRGVDLVMRQFDGMVDGFEARRQHEQGQGADGVQLPELGKDGFLFTNGNGELYDIIDAYQPPSYHEMDASTLHSTLAVSGRCSALITVSGDLSDLLVGHSTWDSYSQLTKVHKHLDLALTTPGLASCSFSMSSYPGELFSDDDLYLLDNNITIISTTNKIFNDELFKLLHPETLVSWQRVRVANWLAHTGEEWVRLLDTLNSGTYNNQYMVLDLNKFEPGKALQPGLLWVAEQIPGLVAAADMTSHLERGYWPSYNVPFFPEVFDRSGFREFAQQQAARGPAFANATQLLSYEMAPRAQMFRRDAAGVNDLHSLRREMRYNNYETDKYSYGDPYSAVCSRGDLAKHPVPKGCLDSKITNYQLALKRVSEAVVGPTAQGHLPPFSWQGGMFDDVLHEGQVQSFDFDWERQSPELRWSRVEIAAA